jgi:hypothetical protein
MSAKPDNFDAIFLCHRIQYNNNDVMALSFQELSHCIEQHVQYIEPLHCGHTRRPLLYLE